MTYRDEKDALRARVSKLETENAELREKLDPKPAPKPPPPMPPRDPAKAPSFGAQARAWLRRALWATVVVGLFGGILYASCVSFRAVVWRGDTTFTCPLNGDATIRNKTIRVDEGPAIQVDINCSLRLVHCDIRGRRGLELTVNNHVVIEDSHIECTDEAISLGTNGEVAVSNSTVVGPIVPAAGRIAGLTDFPLASITAERHAVAPLSPALIERARQIARLGPGATLTGVGAVYVSADGTVDLEAADYKGSIRYDFEAPVHAEVVEPPAVRPGLPVPPVSTPMTRMVKSVELDAKGMRVAGGSLATGNVLEHPAAPRCSFAQIWELARREVPANAVAQMSFDAAGEGSWRFAIANTEHKLAASNTTCQRAHEEPQ